MKQSVQVPAVIAQIEERLQCQKEERLISLCHKNISRFCLINKMLEILYMKATMSYLLMEVEALQIDYRHLDKQPEAWKNKSLNLPNTNNHLRSLPQTKK